MAYLSADAKPDGTAIELPQTWEQYRKWLHLGAGDAKRAAPPLSGRDAACLLIARALACTEAQRRHEALFDPGSMKPRITEPPFVRALSELVEEDGNDANKAPADFAAGLEQVRRGEAAAAFGWPGLLREAKPASPTAAATAVVAPLPVSEQVYTASSSRWEPQIFRQAAILLGVEGRLVAVTTSSRNAVSAFQFAQWITSGDSAIQLSSRSHGALWFRSSQASAYTRWLKGEVKSAAQSPLAELVATALSTESPVLIPRMPGIDDYLNALGIAIHGAKSGEAGAQAALNSAAAAWDALTDRLGRQQQAAAYRRHLGIDSVSESNR
jgi:multiple sugar transport system substrate-binding protein